MAAARRGGVACASSCVISSAWMKRFASVRGLLTPLLGARVHAVVLRRAALRDGERFLEAGVGIGSTFVPLAHANPTGRSEGIDLERPLLGCCRRRLACAGADRSGVRPQRADVGALPFTEASLDLAAACYLMDELAPADRGRAPDELRVYRRLGIASEVLRGVKL